MQVMYFSRRGWRAWQNRKVTTARNRFILPCGKLFDKSFFSPYRRSNFFSGSQLRADLAIVKRFRFFGTSGLDFTGAAELVLTLSHYHGRLVRTGKLLDCPLYLRLAGLYIQRTG